MEAWAFADGKTENLIIRALEKTIKVQRRKAGTARRSGVSRRGFAGCTRVEGSVTGCSTKGLPNCPLEQK